MVKIIALFSEGGGLRILDNGRESGSLRYDALE